MLKSPGEIDWSHPTARKLKNDLGRTFKVRKQIDQFAKESGLQPETIEEQPTTLLHWVALLEAAARRVKLQTLLKLIKEDPDAEAINQILNEALKNLASQLGADGVLPLDTTLQECIGTLELTAVDEISDVLKVMVQCFNMHTMPTTQGAFDQYIAPLNHSSDASSVLRHMLRVLYGKNTRRVHSEREDSPLEFLWQLYLNFEARGHTADHSPFALAFCELAKIDKLDKERREMIQDKAQQRFDAQKKTQYHLVFKVVFNNDSEEHSPCFNVKIWIVETREGLPGWLPITRKTEEHSQVSLLEIRHKVSILSDNPEISSIQAYIPVDLMNTFSDMDSWKTTLPWNEEEETQEAGQTKFVYLRYWERAYHEEWMGSCDYTGFDNYVENTIARWKKNWECAKQHLATRPAEWPEQFVDTQTLECFQSCTIPGSCCAGLQTNALTAKEFNKLLYWGTPIIVWPREPLVTPWSLWHDDLLSATLNEWHARVKESRQDTGRSKQDRFVSVIWDDPSKPPPDLSRYQAPRKL